MKINLSKEVSLFIDSKYSRNLPDFYVKSVDVHAKLEVQGWKKTRKTTFGWSFYNFKYYIDHLIPLLMKNVHIYLSDEGTFFAKKWNEDLFKEIIIKKFLSMKPVITTTESDKIDLMFKVDSMSMYPLRDSAFWYSVPSATPEFSYTPIAIIDQDMVYNPYEFQVSEFDKLDVELHYEFRFANGKKLKMFMYLVSIKAFEQNYRGLLDQSNSDFIPIKKTMIVKSYEFQEIEDCIRLCLEDIKGAKTYERLVLGLQRIFYIKED
jgi:hypothetical protein